MLTNRLKFFLESLEIIEEELAGFRNGMFTSNYIMKFVRAIKSGFNTRKRSLAENVDFQGTCDTICREKLINNNYPEPEWIQVYTDRSKMNDAAAAGLHVRLFSQLCPSGSAIETVAFLHLSESLIVSEIKQVKWELIMNGKIVEFQHVDINGNEKAGQLANKGTKSHLEILLVHRIPLKEA
ncbi:hypothetical protein NPIL_603151 [Nephila pilipes]|uniref:Uncharacterized protein n=1 Tax=Nephila pilipes TaxID=299642 RepID=A0A8X6NMI5_NEPPI|nr:hypothetical protein NPIL_603151 [Nephila pilipes]